MMNPEENQLLNMETHDFRLHVWNLTQFHVAIQPQSAIKSLLVGWEGEEISHSKLLCF